METAHYLLMAGNWEERVRIPLFDERIGCEIYSSIQISGPAEIANCGAIAAEAMPVLAGLGGIGAQGPRRLPAERPKATHRTNRRAAPAFRRAMARYLRSDVAPRGNGVPVRGLRSFSELIEI